MLFFSNKTLGSICICLLFCVPNSIASDNPCGEILTPSISGEYTYSPNWFAPYLIFSISNMATPQDDDADAIDADQKIEDYFLVLDSNITYLTGQADYRFAQYQYYLSIGQPTLAASEYALYEQFSWEKDLLIAEKNHWIKFKIAVEDAKNAPTNFYYNNFTSAVDFHGKLAYLKGYCQTGCFDSLISPVWDTMPVNSATHGFMTGPSFGDEVMIFLMYKLRSAAVGNRAAYSSRNFFFTAAVPQVSDPENYLPPEITILIDGIPWVQGNQTSLLGVENEDEWEIGISHRVEVFLQYSIIDEAKFPSWTHDATMKVGVFAFDWTIRKETHFDAKCNLMANN